MTETEVQGGSGLPPTCPDCDGPMTLRTARRGRNAGGLFWGCDDYPRCKGIREHGGPRVEIDAVTTNSPDLLPVEAGPAPTCPDPSCGAPMQLKLARRGRNAGGYFWSCTRFPACRETRDYEGPGAGHRAAGENGGQPEPARIPRRVIWADGTLDRPGWTCRYTAVGGSLRAFPESQQVAPMLSQCWIARTEGLADVDPDVERVAGLLKKIIQRGTAPPLDPASERALLESAGLGDGGSRRRPCPAI